MESSHFADKSLGRDGQRVVTFFVVVAILLAMGLRTVHYVANPSMWFDELAIARNVADRTLSELMFKPLDHLQVAPVGFLTVTRVSTMLFGVNEFALRLMPWVFAVIAPIVFWLIARRFVTGFSLIAALLLFAVSPALTWYGGNVKQYLSDITISIILVWLAMQYHERPVGTWWAVIAGSVGGLLITCSQPAVATAFLLGAILAAESLLNRERKPLSTLVPLGVGWGLGALIATAFALRTVDPVTMDHMKDFWSQGFPPTDSISAFLVWYPLQIAATFGVFLFHVASNMPPLAQIAVALAVLAIPGCVYLLRRDRWSTALLLAPLIGALIMATFHLLPFRHRVGLHAVWPILLLAMASFRAFRGRFPKTGRWLVPIALLVFAGLPSAAILAMGRPPYRGHQEMRPLLKEFAARRKPGDAIYVFYGAAHAMHFYGHAFEINPEDWTEGGIHYGDNRAYLHEVDAFRGRPRVWFVYTHMLRFEAPKEIIAYLNEIGTQLDVLTVTYGMKGQGESAAYLFDLSDPERLNRDSAERFTIQP